MKPSRKTAEILGVHPNTLRRWANEGKIKYVETPGGQRLYDVESFVKKTKERKKVCYCRVSSNKQRDDLERQVRFMRSRYPNHDIIEDIGSGLNFKRKGLVALLELVCSGDIEEVVVAHRDRLCRFGFGLIEWLINKNGGKLVVLEGDEMSPQQELIQDIISIISIFACRIHGLRKYRTEIKKDSILSNKGAEASS